MVVWFDMMVGYLSGMIGMWDVMIVGLCDDVMVG